MAIGAAARLLVSKLMEIPKLPRRAMRNYRPGLNRMHTARSLRLRPVS